MEFYTAKLLFSYGIAPAHQRFLFNLEVVERVHLVGHEQRELHGLGGVFHGQLGAGGVVFLRTRPPME
jgi:hypothetical protein